MSYSVRCTVKIASASGAVYSKIAKLATGTGEDVKQGLQGAHVIAVQWEAFSFLPGFAIGTAAGALAGQYLGANNIKDAKKSTIICIVLAVIFMGTMGLCMMLWGSQLTSVISHEPMHLSVVPKLLFIAGIRLGDTLLLVHDTPALHESAYVHEVEHAVVAFESLDEGICLHGHTHLPTVFSTNQGKATAENITFQVPTDGEPIVLDPTQRHLCNPGAVGQPRDSDPRASFAILEHTTPEEEAVFTVHRTEYDITATQEATEKAGLPVILAERLSMGA